jgi:hypothetical protein
MKHVLPLLMIFGLSLVFLLAADLLSHLTKNEAIKEGMFWFAGVCYMATAGSNIRE